MTARKLLNPESAKIQDVHFCRRELLIQVQTNPTDSNAALWNKKMKPKCIQIYIIL